MNELSDQEIKKNKNVVTDFVCPTKGARKKFSADYIIWMNTIDQGRFEDTNKMFEIPDNQEIDFEVKEKNAEAIKHLILTDLKLKFEI